MNYRRGLVALCCGVVLFLSGGCHFTTAGTWVDGQIDPKIRTTMRDLNTNVIHDISTKDTASLKTLFSDTLWNRVGPGFATQVEKNEVAFDPARFKEKNQFYIVYKRRKNPTPTSTGARAANTIMSLPSNR